MLKELKLNAGEMLSWNAVSEKVMRNRAAQQAAVAKLQGRVEYYKGLGDRGDKTIELTAVAEVPLPLVEETALRSWKKNC